jgi:hypothetical protein
MPLLQNKQRPSRCPDAETLCALAQDDVSEPHKEAFVAHTAACPTCANLHERLRGFHEASPSSQGPEWGQTQKRLDNWIESFLAAEAPVRTVASHARQSGQRLSWQIFAESFRALQIRWVVVPAAALALVVCAFFIGRISVRPVPQQLAEAVPSKESIPDATTRRGAIKDAPITDPQLLSQSGPPPAHGSPTQPNAIAPGRPPSSGLPSASAGSPQVESTTETTAIIPSVSPNAAVAEPAGVASVSEPPAIQNNSALQTAQTNSPTTPINPVGIVKQDAAARVSPPTEVRSITALRSNTSAPPKKVASPPPAPAEVRIEAGTRVWISLKSVRQRADGGSDFSGTVLLPVMQSGAALLAQNTQISGILSVKQDKTKVQIMEFASNGAHYRLKGTGGDANTGSGTGTAVKFDAGKVLETWMVSASTFGKLPEESKPVEK